MGRQYDLQGLRGWLARALGADSSLLAVDLLPGATSSTLFRVRVQAGGELCDLVLRLFTNQEWLCEEPDLVQHEAASLRHAACEPAAMPTPHLVAVDEPGTVCGAPAVLMTALPGRVDLRPADQRAWLSQMACAIAAVHQTRSPDFPWKYRTYNDLNDLAAPQWSRRGDVWARAIKLAQERAPATPSCFIHRDYHPCNVLWQGGKISGIVDWVNACEGPAGIDVGHCRLNLALLQGVGTADAFLHHYRAAAGVAFDYHPYWDLVSLLECLPGPPVVYQGWLDFGVTGLTDRLMAERLEAYLLSLLRRF